METLNESRLISIIREEYTNRLVTVGKAINMLETDVFNDRGDLLLSKGLKVRHKDSGYEYTIDHVDGEGDSAVVFLRHPEVPRFQPPDSIDPLMEQESEVPEDQPPILAKKSDEMVGLLRVSLEDFENDYEVD